MEGGGKGLLENIRVRYAPSPTGEPHLGNIRTALFNWLFARRYGGSFIVRFEDTDRTRYVAEALPTILETLEWLGLDWDEGPTIGTFNSEGPYGPYIQSQRLQFYRDTVDVLVDKGCAYSCYCSPDRLKELRLSQQRTKSLLGYDGHCRNLSSSEKDNLEKMGTSKVIRFRIPREGTTSVKDIIRGEVVWENQLLDDFVLIKSDGFPTYHLAVVTDDHLMRISHVMRAEEWLPSTPRHLMIYDSLGWQPPAFAHLPMILGSDRSKLSKRHGATSALSYRDQGYLPDAMFNFLALLGWSLDDKTELLSREALVSSFSLGRVSKAGAVFDQEKLSWMNGVYLRQLTADALITNLQPFVERPFSSGGLPDSIPRSLVKSRLISIVPLIQERMKTLSQGTELVSLFLEEKPFYPPELLLQKGMDIPATCHVLALTRSVLERVGLWGALEVETAVRPLIEELSLNIGQLFGSIRAAVTGRVASPPLFQTMEVLGREVCLLRLTQAIEKLISGDHLNK
jgi:glutamyl-tRNA synthetase